MMNISLPIAITMGEPSGIGGEIALKAWLRREELRLTPFFLVDDPNRLKQYLISVGLECSGRNYRYGA